MNAQYLDSLREALQRRGIATVRGLTPAEIAATEQDYGFTFPPDLRMLLESFVPAGDDFPDWHQPHSQDLIEWLDFPSDGIAFDVEENGYWHEAWGPRPDDVDDAVDEALGHVTAAPILVPLYTNHFLPSRPAASGNPVLRVIQSEVTVTGCDLGWFFHDQLGGPTPSWPQHEPVAIDFWSALARR